MDKKYKNQKYTIVATDIVIFTIRQERLQVLLIKMKKAPFFDFWAAPGGLVPLDQTIDDAARFHLAQKTGLKDVYLEQLYTFGELDRDPHGRVVSITYFALIPSDNLNLQTSSDYEDVNWFDVEQLPRLAYDHQQVINYGLDRLRAKLEYTNVVYSLLANEFTLTELQRVYEVILDRKLDKRNFRRKFLSLGLIVKTAHKKLNGAHRPAQLFKFKQKTPQMVNIL